MGVSLLLVEDDALARLAIRAILENVGYHVTEVPDGETALLRISTETFDVVITDMRMRGVDGIEVLHHAMSQPIPPMVIILTGQGTLDSAIAALRTGAYDYLVKPCMPTAILESVAGAVTRRKQIQQQTHTIQHLSTGLSKLQQQLFHIEATEPHITEIPPKPQIASETITIGSFSIGRFHHEARYQNQNLHLTPIEHALLRRLAEERGGTVRYSEIIRETHQVRLDESEAQLLLKSHVRNIRRKIGTDLIVSVRNIGYRLDTDLLL